MITFIGLNVKSDIDEKQLIDLIIDDIPDNFNAITRLFGASTISELIDRMDNYKPRRQWIRANMNINKPRTAVAANHINKMCEDERCYKCFNYGHSQSKCPKSECSANSCFVCVQVGHFHKDCPKKRSLTAAIKDGVLDDGLDAFQMVRVAFIKGDDQTVHSVK